MSFDRWYLCLNVSKAKNVICNIVYLSQCSHDNELCVKWASSIWWFPCLNVPISKRVFTRWSLLQCFCNICNMVSFPITMGVICKMIPLPHVPIERGSFARRSLCLNVPIGMGSFARLCLYLNSPIPMRVIWHGLFASMVR